ncbi:polysaccharide biosynthesis C-terminal domain-containing protein [Caulobacter sp. SL161]|uniref:polysaccharide biosynthesis C-terminal domain-containing protein n=1 Tax=Caulobacter sp. SL161 TaxID=2995156 RepID=UPI0022724951|nr:polysaccharide biosynthesis C-terminal domain-containing protein [Caulobacter sp. SL161]MCY1648413.1 polysaccharide biosynthesis C-terminal domain-containing protein [Caulobacter sp. SL161]
MASRGLTRVSQVVAFLLLARVLSPEGFGAYAVVTSAIFLAGQIGTLGLRQAAAYRIGQKIMSDGEAVGVLAAFWPIAAVLCAAGVYALNRDSFEALGLGLTTAALIACAAVLLLNLMQGVFLGRGEIRAFAFSDSGPRVLQSVFAALLWLFGALTLDTALWSFAAGFILLAPMVIWMAARPANKLDLAIVQVPAMVRHGFLFAVSAFLVMLQGRIGVFFLSGADGEVAAGQFFAAQRASEIFLELATAAGLVLFSETARGGATREKLESAVRTATGLFVMFLGVGAVAAATAPWLVATLLGPQYAGATDALRILAIGLAPAAAVRILNSVIAGMGRPYISAGIVFGGMALNALVCMILVPKLGASGAAFGLVGGQTLAAATYAALCWVQLRASKQTENMRQP